VFQYVFTAQIAELGESIESANLQLEEIERKLEEIERKIKGSIQCGN
jgi:hypothetical protein